MAIRRITEHEGAIMDLFRDAALKHNVNIIAGSTPSMRGDDVYNVSHVFKRDGSHESQDKIHPTPNESYWWNIVGGDEVRLMDTDCGPIAVQICYDVEFPELCRHLTDQGINILFVPFLTDERQSYCRVRYCAQARAVEESDLRRDVRQLRQPAERSQHGHSLRTELHPDAVRFSVRP